MKICENCGNEHNSEYSSGRFCSEKCARGFSTKNKRKEINKKVSNKLISKSLKNAWEKGKYNNVDWHEVGAKGSKGKYNNDVDSIVKISRRTVSKILERIAKNENIGCCICGWKESTCDIHHIKGRKITDADNHINLALVCPNHHRMLTNKVIDDKCLLNLKDHIGDIWKKYYYG